MDATVRLLTPLSWAPRQGEVCPDDWQAAWRFCGFHGVRPALAQSLKRLPESCLPPPWLVADLADFTRGHAFAVLQKTAEIVSLSNALEAEGVTAVFFKGAVLGEQVYGAAQFREFNDIDLLVSLEDRDRVADLLEASGYLPVIADRLFRRAFFDYAGQHMFRHRDSGSVVDLHWNFVGNLDFPVDAAEVMRNRTMLALGGVRVPAPSIEDLALILAGHGQKEGWASFGWALDFAKFSASFPDFDWDKAARRAQDKGGLGALLTALLMVERLFGRVLDQDLVAKARQSRRIVDDVERIIIGYHALAERRLADDLMGSFRLCETALQRARVWWGLLTTRTISDYEALPLPPRWWWVYRLTRPFRLAWQTLRGRPPTPSALFEGHKKS
ncbi:hypothetical protein GVM20_00515 [Porphyrobacter sp. SLTP]|nr:nucleotidyltransferase family protein [Porphyrobacter sp. SLTP]NBB23605.1 hypothetical protein [Porphyrobacter sp. SLTP]